MIVVDEFASLGQVGSDEGAGPIGKEWVVVPSGRKRALRQPDHDHLVEFEAERRAGGTDENAVAERAAASEIVTELEFEGTSEGHR